MSFQSVDLFSKKKDRKVEWDDRDLIEAYNVGMENVKIKHALVNGVASSGKGNKCEKPRKKWKVGNFCQAVFSEDGELYEAEIVEIDKENKNCVVNFLGYDNEEEVSLVSLKLSHGKSIRRRQIDAARELNVVKWKVGDACRAMYKEDGLFYEAIIKEMHKGRATCLVKFTEYENEEVVELKNVEPIEEEHSSDDGNFGASNKFRECRRSSDEASSSGDSDASHSASEDPYDMPDRSDASRHSKSSGRANRSCCPMPRQFMIPEPPFFSDEDTMMAMSSGRRGVSDEVGPMLIAWYMAGFHTGYYQGQQSRSHSGNHGERRNFRH